MQSEPELYHISDSDVITRGLAKLGIVFHISLFRIILTFPLDNELLIISALVLHHEPFIMISDYVQHSVTL